MIFIIWVRVLESVLLLILLWSSPRVYTPKHEFDISYIWFYFYIGSYNLINKVYIFGSEIVKRERGPCFAPPIPPPTQKLSWLKANSELMRNLSCYFRFIILTVSWAEIWKFSKSQRDIFDAITISKIIVFQIICNFANHSAAKFTFPIKQPSNKATKCGIRRSSKLKVKPNLGCCSNIAIIIFDISVFVSSW